MLQKLVIAAIVLLAGIWFAGDVTTSPVRQSVTAPRIDGPNYLPEPSLPGPVDSSGTIDPRDFRLNGMPYPGDPADPGFCSAPGSGLPCDPPTP